MPFLHQHEPIAAFATALGGPVVVIRISGDGAVAAADAVWRGKRPLAALPGRTFHLGAVVDSGQCIDEGVLAVRFPAPGSFTGEDVVELHCHGGVLGARLALQAVLRNGARPADPGEFTQRAFLNGRLDLTQAEAVNDLIRAQTHAALRVANAQLRGGLKRTVDERWQQCRDLLTELEVSLDFPEEDSTPTVAPPALAERARALGDALQELAASKLEGRVVREGIGLVIAGAPNVGKSTLLNAILGRDRAIVSEIPGTTRDTLEELAHIRDIPVRLTDTAGIRDAEDAVERLGVERSRGALRTAQIILWLREADHAAESVHRRLELSPQVRIIEVVNKIDRTMEARPRRTETAAGAPTIFLSALAGKGLDLLYDAIEEAVWQVPHHAVPEIAVSDRHAQLLEQAARDVADACDALEREELDVAAVSVRGALNSLGRIVGRDVTSEDILGDIFSNFCMGK